MLTPVPHPLTFKEQIMKTAVVSRQEQKLWQEGEKNLSQGTEITGEILHAFLSRPKFSAASLHLDLCSLSKHPGKGPR